MLQAPPHIANRWSSCNYPPHLLLWFSYRKLHIFLLIHSFDKPKVSIISLNRTLSPASNRFHEFMAKEFIMAHIALHMHTQCKTVFILNVKTAMRRHTPYGVLPFSVPSIWNLFSIHQSFFSTRILNNSLAATQVLLKCMNVIFNSITNHVTEIILLSCRPEQDFFNQFHSTNEQKRLKYFHFLETSKIRAFIRH